MLRQILPIMLALSLMLSATYYAYTYNSIYCMVQNFDREILIQFDEFLAIRQNLATLNFLPIASCLHVRLIKFLKILLV